MENGGLISSMG